MFEPGTLIVWKYVVMGLGPDVYLVLSCEPINNVVNMWSFRRGRRVTEGCEGAECYMTYAEYKHV